MDQLWITCHSVRDNTPVRLDIARARGFTASVGVTRIWMHLDDGEDQPVDVRETAEQIAILIFEADSPPADGFHDCIGSEADVFRALNSVFGGGTAQA